MTLVIISFVLIFEICLAYSRRNTWEFHRHMLAAIGFGSFFIGHIRNEVEYLLVGMIFIILSVLYWATKKSTS